MPRRVNRVRRDAAEWGALLERQEASGLSRLAFCRRERIPPSSMTKWRKQLTSLPARFVELTPSPVQPAGWELEVALPNGAVLRFRG